MEVEDVSASFCLNAPIDRIAVQKISGISGLFSVQKSGAFLNCEVVALSMSGFGLFSPDGILEMIYREKYSYRMILLGNNDWLLLCCIDELVKARLGIFLRT